MKNQITSLTELQEKIEANRYDYFQFPVLDIKVKYRKPDLLKLSFNNSLPTAMANAVIAAYKEAVGSADIEEYKATAAKELKADDELVKDLATKGYVLLTELCISPKIMDVPASDFETEPPLISWNDVPEEDAIAFLLSLIQKAQTAKTKAGGEVSATDIETFPGGKRRPKRSDVGENG